MQTPIRALLIESAVLIVIQQRGPSSIEDIRLVLAENDWLCKTDEIPAALLSLQKDGLILMGNRDNLEISLTP